jgi:hypothetical protein
LARIVEEFGRECVRLLHDVADGTPLMTGLLLMATASALLGFIGVNLLWKKR